MIEEDYIKQVAVRGTVNPSAGSISVNGNQMQNVVFSSRPVLLLAHELTSISMTDVSGNPIAINSFDVTINRAIPVINIDDTQTFVPGASVVRIAQVTYTMFYGYQYGSLVPVLRPVNLIVNPNQDVDITFAIRLMTPAVGNESLQWVYRLFWKEL